MLSGGTQNLIVQFRRDDREYVLRRPSRHPRAGADDTMRREARVLAALEPTPVRCPRFVAVCTDSEVLGAAFYLMDPVEGVNINNGLSPVHAASAACRRRMGFEMVDAILALGAVDPGQVGLADFGKVEGYLERQVPRWRRQLEGYSECKGWPGLQVLPGVDEAGTWLEANCPSGFQPGLLHGDFHLGNVMFRSDGPQLEAIIDWELATLGDPLLDLGWLLVNWPRPDGSHHATQLIHPWEGFPTAQELIDRYAAGSPRDLTNITWYVVMACFKLAILLEGSHARACAGLAPKAIGDRLHRAALGLMGKAEHWMKTGGPEC
jgi:aminoglycoside phosphotransferase (APT) family kinase protein